eukprot:jgi/Botrbrau1/16707/Bobra.0263s0004.1
MGSLLRISGYRSAAKPLESPPYGSGTVRCYGWRIACICFFSVSLPGTPTLSNPANHRYAFGNVFLVTSAFIGQVRFHVQLMFTSVVMAAGVALIAINTRLGLFSATSAFLVSYAASGILPCVVIYYLDKYSRKTFLNKFRARQLNWMRDVLR